MIFQSEKNAINIFQRKMLHYVNEMQCDVKRVLIAENIWLKSNAV